MIIAAFIFVSKVNLIIAINDHWTPLKVNSHRGDRAAQTNFTPKKNVHI